MIDKTLFPTEYAAVERLKKRSDRICALRDKNVAQKQKKIEKWRRALDEEHSV